MKTCMMAVLLLQALACMQHKSNTGITGADKASLEVLNGNYRKFWLENDSTKVVNLFSDEGAIVPPGNKGDIVKGKKAIGARWFTKNGDTTYPITKFEYNSLLLTASGTLATWEGTADFGWNTMAGQKQISTHTSTTNFITVCRKEGAEWKIYRQIWNVKPSK